MPTHRSDIDRSRSTLARLRLRGAVLGAAITVACGGRESLPSGGDSAERGELDTATVGLTGASVGEDAGGDGTERGDGADAGRLDVGPDGPAAGPVDCTDRDEDGTPDFSHIWIANTPQGTVSKIDTKTGVELGRYLTGPGDPSGLNPSRTSVNLRGDVAVANRGRCAPDRDDPDCRFPGEPPVTEDPSTDPGSLTMIAAVEADCIDTNGNGQIDTSSGATDILPWGEDECVRWHHPIPSRRYDYGPRPVAWEPGETCEAPNVWVGWYDDMSGDGVFRRIAGGDGQTLDEVRVPWPLGGTSTKIGPYGGAVNADGDLWVLGFQAGPLIRIDHDTLEVESWPMARAPWDSQTWAYGMALDGRGHPWVSSLTTVAHFDPDAGRWSPMPVAQRGLMLRGIAVDLEGRAWVPMHIPRAEGGSCALAEIDTATGTLSDGRIALPGCGRPVGVSIDVDGFVWVVDQLANQAYKVDPDTHQIALTVGGLIGPYTYSDMTGAGLRLVVNPTG